MSASVAPLRGNPLPVVRPAPGLRATARLLAVVAVALAAVAASRLDQRLADALYALEGHRWAWKHAFVTDGLIHRGGRALSLAAWCVVLGAWARSLVVDGAAAWRRPLAYLVLAPLASVLVVAWIKSWSGMDCPWDLVRYGGSRPFVGLLESRPAQFGDGRCFPAAHAGAGYAWVALYFFLSAVRPERRRLGLAVGLSAGVVFGASQQLRGAHFLSHDLWSLAICWSIAAGLYAAFRPAGVRARATAGAEPHG